MYYDQHIEKRMAIESNIPRPTQQSVSLYTLEFGILFAIMCMSKFIFKSITLTFNLSMQMDFRGSTGPKRARTDGKLLFPS